MHCKIAKYFLSEIILNILDFDIWIFKQPIKMNNGKVRNEALCYYLEELGKLNRTF